MDRGEASESALTAMTHQTRSACFDVPAEVQNCQTVQDRLSFVLESFVMSSSIVEPHLVN